METASRIKIEPRYFIRTYTIDEELETDKMVERASSAEEWLDRLRKVASRKATWMLRMDFDPIAVKGKGIDNLIINEMKYSFDQPTRVLLEAYEGTDTFLVRIIEKPGVTGEYLFL